MSSFSLLSMMLVVGCFLKKYLFIYLAALGLSCGAWAPEHAGSVVAARGLSSCGVRALEHAGLVAPWHVGS